MAAGALRGLGLTTHRIHEGEGVLAGEEIELCIYKCINISRDKLMVAQKHSAHWLGKSIKMHPEA